MFEVRTGRDFTPIEVSFDIAGKIRVCAYTGCWAGKAQTLLREPFLLFSQANVDWSDPNRRIARRADILIAFDFNDHIAMVKACSFAVPMGCPKVP